MATRNSQHSVTFAIKGETDKAVQPVLSLTAAVVPKVTCDLSLQGATGVKSYSHLKDLSLADPNFDQPGKIDLLIGCNTLQDIFKADIKKSSSEQPMAMRTIFCWVATNSIRSIHLLKPLWSTLLLPLPGHMAC